MARYPKQHLSSKLSGLLPASILFAMLAAAAHAQQAIGVPGAPSATATGEDCRKEICNSAVAGCLRADLSLNPLASTEAEKRTYCAQFFPGCMNRYITPDMPWYSSEMADKFLKCPSR